VKGAPGYVAAEVDTRVLPSLRRADFWREHVTQNHGRLAFTFGDAEHFVGGTRVQRKGDLQLVDFWSSPIAYERSPDGHNRDGDDGLRILLPSCGSICVVVPDARYQIGAGTAVVLPMTQYFRLEHDQYARALIVSLPRRLWHARVPTNPLTWELRQGIGAVFAATLREVSNQWANLDAASFVSSMESAACLIARGATSTEDELAFQARAVARQHCDNGSFDPTELARRLGWSLRSVQYGLQREGTTAAALIQELRLERAASRLQHPGWTDQTVSAIAYASGFSSLSTFNAAFRKRYDSTPVEYRRKV